MHTEPLCCLLHKAVCGEGINDWPVAYWRQMVLVQRGFQYPQGPPGHHGITA